MCKSRRFAEVVESVVEIVFDSRTPVCLRLFLSSSGRGNGATYVSVFTFSDAREFPYVIFEGGFD